jgi:hypothetical protein
VMLYRVVSNSSITSAKLSFEAEREAQEPADGCGTIVRPRSSPGNEYVSNSFSCRSLSLKELIIVELTPKVNAIARRQRISRESLRRSLFSGERGTNSRVCVFADTRVIS